MGLPNCKACDVGLKDYRSKLCRTCARLGKLNPMAGKYAAKHPRYKGGYIHKTLGYKFIMVKGQKFYEHRLVAEKKLGRKLRKGEIVHHINHIKTDNRPENLEVTTQAIHVAIHKPMLGKKSKVKRDPTTQRFTR